MLRAAWLIALVTCIACQRASGGPPNVVLIVFDDMGWGDVACNHDGAPDGSPPPFATPNIDRVASQGMRLTDFYTAQPVCSASRCAILTGRYPNRVGISGALFPDATNGIADGELTLAELLRSAGYSTAAFGKWHLGHLEPFAPTLHGFDSFLGIPYSNDMWAARNAKQFPPLPLIDSRGTDTTIDDMDEQAQLTKRLTDAACAQIRASAGKPFFVYLAHPQPHAPIAPGKQFANSTGKGTYADVIAELDWSVGEVCRAIDEAGVADRTLLIITSDNGPWLSLGNHAGTTAGLREGKGTTFEGGVRVPGIIRYPGHIEAGSTSAVPAMTIDLMPTIADLCEVRSPEGAPPMDGRTLRGVLCGNSTTAPHEALYFYYHNNQLEAMRCGRWKLHLPHKYRRFTTELAGRDGAMGSYEEGTPIELALYDLGEDPRELHDVAAAHPETVESLLKLVEAARADMGDALTNRAPRLRTP